MSEKIKSIINSLIPISINSIEKINNIITVETFNKGTSITETNNTNNSEYFVLEGICKSCIDNTEGEEITLSFFMSNTIISPFTTRTINGKSVLNIKCLTEATIAKMDAYQFENMMIEDEEIRNFANTVLRNELMHKVQKEIGLASLPAKVRLQQLRKQFPNIENLVPHSDIASYLGITTISLSRLRSQS